jgi:predicted nucleic acid-binding protein
VELRGWGPQRRGQLTRFLRRFLTIHSDPDIVRTWAFLRAYSQAQGRMMERQDAWIAAVAISLDAPLVTHNAADFEHLPMLSIITEPDR